MSTNEQAAVEDLVIAVSEEVHEQISEYEKAHNLSTIDTKSSQDAGKKIEEEEDVKEDEDSTTPVILTNSYSTNFGEYNAVTFPVLTFGFPSNWSIKTQETNQGGELVTIANERGVEVTYRYLMQSNMNGPMWEATFKKVSDAQFSPGWVQATDYSSLGAFSVANILVDGQMESDIYALAQDSLSGTTETRQGLPIDALSTHWAGELSFVTTETPDGLTSQERQEVVAILASLRVTG